MTFFLWEIHSDLKNIFRAMKIKKKIRYGIRVYILCGILRKYFLIIQTKQVS